jgi:AcrR family transcriptional regulator
MEDQRIVKTRQALYQALAGLLKEKEFERITVSDIIREAHVTRKTFYNHYQDKIELVQEYQAMLSREILALQSSHGTLDL